MQEKSFRRVHNAHTTHNTHVEKFTSYQKHLVKRRFANIFADINACMHTRFHIYTHTHKIAWVKQCPFFVPRVCVCWLLCLSVSVKNYCENFLPHDNSIAAQLNCCNFWVAWGCKVVLIVQTNAKILIIPIL